MSARIVTVQSLLIHLHRSLLLPLKYHLHRDRAMLVASKRRLSLFLQRNCLLQSHSRFRRIFCSLHRVRRKVCRPQQRFSISSLSPTRRESQTHPPLFSTRLRAMQTSPMQLKVTKLQQHLRSTENFAEGVEGTLTQRAPRSRFQAQSTAPMLRATLKTRMKSQAIVRIEDEDVVIIIQSSLHHKSSPFLSVLRQTRRIRSPSRSLFQSLSETSRRQRRRSTKSSILSLFRIFQTTTQVGKVLATCSATMQATMIKAAWLPRLVLKSQNSSSTRSTHRRMKMMFQISPLNQTVKKTSLNMTIRRKLTLFHR